MANYDYNRDVPDGPNNPSEDQPDMKVNTNSIDDLIDEDHYSFEQANGGFHKQVRMPNLGAIPGGLIASSGTLYTKSSNGFSQLFYTNGTSGNEYQLTRTNTTNFSTFSTFTVFDGTQPRVTGGWTFLPGGLILQYGFLSNPVNNDTIKFPISYATFALPTLGQVRNNTDDKTISIKTGSVLTSQFQIILSGSSLPTGLYWQVIGK